MLENENENIFDIYSNGLSLNFTLDGGNFNNVSNNGGSYVYLNGDAKIKILDVSASDDRNFLTGYDIGSVDILRSHFTNFEEAIQIIRNNTIKWPEPSRMNIEESTFLSSRDTNMILITQLSIRDELLIQYSNFTLASINISLKY